ncbi:MAG: HAD-IB family phosphatase [Gammaproteobacteria bacterium]|nr:HAD-IB family phosphatase [Gammaproteobacteria bacterium]
MPVDLVLFDCDSTLTRIEGVDELARLRGVAEPVAALTAAAMVGKVSVEEVYGRRLELIRPDRDALEWLGRQYVASMVEGATEVVWVLRELGKEVHIISGGFRPAINALARALDIPEANVHAVDLHFDERGAYAGFDARSPLTRSGGKGDVVDQLIGGAARAMAIGDGVTDLEMKRAGVGFIGFGGVVRREPVAAGADVYVDSRSLDAVLPLILTSEELGRLGVKSAGG